MKHIQIKSINDLIDKIKSGNNEYFILIAGVARSSKFIIIDDNTVYVLNEIDSIEEELSMEEFKKQYSNHIQKGLLYQFVY